jgi:imidazoleglycerol-phosphate dehydratase/histidinol-phosphatase
MLEQKVLFIDRDGTLVEEPADEQVDALGKIRLLPGVIPALLALQDAGFRLVLVSNQDGRGTESFPEEAFRESHDFIMSLFASQGIRFDGEYICPHFAHEECACRKPKLGLLEDYLRATPLDRRHSYVIGDRESDMQLAGNLGLEGLRLSAGSGLDWAGIAERLTLAPRVAELRRKTAETDIHVRLKLDVAAPVAIATGIAFFDHMLDQLAKHGGFSLELRCRGDLEVDEHHTVEDCALALGQAMKEALGDKRGIGRYGFSLPMDEARAEVLVDLGGRPYLAFTGAFARESVGGLPTELVPHFYRSLADSLRAAIHVDVKGENAHHMIEATFKGLGRALRPALARSGSVLPTTKGVL